MDRLYRLDCFDWLFDLLDWISVDNYTLSAQLFGTACSITAFLISLLGFLSSIEANTSDNTYIRFFSYFSKHEHTHTKKTTPSWISVTAQVLRCEPSTLTPLGKGRLEGPAHAFFSSEANISRAPLGIFTCMYTYVFLSRHLHLCSISINLIAKTLVDFWFAVMLGWWAFLVQWS